MTVDLHSSGYASTNAYTHVSEIQTPIGYVHIFANKEAISCIEFFDLSLTERMQNEAISDKKLANLKGESDLTKEAASQLNDYFKGTLRDFDLPLAPRGTAFQQSVWQALLEIEYGSHASYLDIAKAVGNAKACRAVGAANGKNPIAIVVPCHRIIGSNGSLTGYAGGMSRKEYLLALESGDASEQLGLAI